MDWPGISHRIWTILPVFSNVVGTFVGALTGMAPQLIWDAEGKSKNAIRIISILISAAFALGAISSYQQQAELERRLTDIPNQVVAKLKNTQAKPFKFKKTDFSFTINRMPFPPTSEGINSWRKNLLEASELVIVVANLSEKTVSDYSIVLTASNCRWRSKSPAWIQEDNVDSNVDTFLIRPLPVHAMELHPGYRMELPPVSIHCENPSGRVMIDITLSIKDTKPFMYSAGWHPLSQPSN